jgi:hypothetical protein
MLWRRSARFGAAALAILYGIFVLFPLPRFYTAPHFLKRNVGAAQLNEHNDLLTS